MLSEFTWWARDVEWWKNQSQTQNKRDWFWAITSATHAQMSRKIRDRYMIQLMSK